MLAVLVRNEEPNFKENIINCNDIVYTFSIPGVKYVGLYYNKKEYLTKYTDSDKLQSDIEKCVTK